MANYSIVSTIPSEIFRAYDIRGIVNETMTVNGVYTIGLALGSFALDRQVKEIAIGRDGRISGPELLQALEAGILASGCNVVNIGEVTTPILYYMATIMNSESGAMLSGSHNPPNYNGIKMVIAGQTLFGDTITELYNKIMAQDFRLGEGKAQNVDIIADYKTRILDDVKLTRKLKVVVDCGNGVGGKIAPDLIRKLGCEVIELYCDVDGNFPHHQPDPAVPENLRDIIAKVKAEKADLGLAFDGDADRVGVITEKGEIIAADRLLMLFAIDLLTRHPGATVTYDVKCSRHLAELIKSHGGVPLMYKTGHSLIKAKMKEINGLLAGELSGHMFIKERWFGFDDGIYVACRFLEMLTKSDKTVSEMFAMIPNSINTPEIKLPISEAEKFQFMEKLQKMAQFPDGVVNTIDGLRVDYPDGFGLIRPSNTSPYLILRFEGESESALKHIQDLFKQNIMALNPNLKLQF